MTKNKESKQPEVKPNEVKPQVAKKQDAKKAAMFPVEDLAKKKGLKPWYLAGLRRAAGWKPGKEVSAAEFEKTVEKFNTRPQGGGTV